MFRTHSANFLFGISQNTYCTGMARLKYLISSGYPQCQERRKCHIVKFLWRRFAKSLMLRGQETINAKHPNNSFRTGCGGHLVDWFMGSGIEGRRYGAGLHAQSQRRPDLFAVEAEREDRRSGVVP